MIGVPGRDAHAAEHGAECGSGIAVNEDLPAILVHPGHGERIPFRHVLARVAEADVHRAAVQLHGGLLALELLFDGAVDLLDLDGKKLAEQADIDHVGEQLPQPHFAGDLGGQFLEGRRVEDEIVPLALQPQPLLVHHRASGFEPPDIPDRRLRVQRHQEVHLALARDPAVPVGADREPGRQPGDIRRKQVLSAHRDPHPEQRPEQHQIRGLAPGAVHRGHLDGQVVDDALPLGFDRDRRLGERRLIGHQQVFRDSCRERGFGPASGRILPAKTLSGRPRTDPSPGPRHRLRRRNGEAVYPNGSTDSRDSGPGATGIRRRYRGAAPMPGPLRGRESTRTRTRCLDDGSEAVRVPARSSRAKTMLIAMTRRMTAVNRGSAAGRCKHLTATCVCAHAGFVSARGVTPFLAAGSPSRLSGPCRGSCGRHLGRCPFVPIG